jgi:Kef-type K+ transport system membrane component KefB
MLALVFVAAMTTYQIGIFAIFGGFMIGVILYDEPGFVSAWRERIGDFVTVFFLPIFFTYTGLRTSIGSLDTLAAWGWCAITIALATAGKMGGAYLAARISGLNHVESAILGYMMNTRGLMELVVINVGFDLGVISPQMYTILVIMAIVSTVITTPALRHYLPRAALR